MSTPTPSLTSSTVTPVGGSHNGEAAEALLQLQMSENSSDKSTEKDSLKKRSRSNDNDNNPSDTEIIVKRVIQNPSRINDATMGDVEIAPLSANPIRKVSRRVPVPGGTFSLNFRSVILRCWD